MNLKQKIGLTAFTLVTVGMLLYPPFHLIIRGTEFNMGYGFLFDPPYRGTYAALVDIPTLLAEWLATILVASVGWLLTRSNVKPPVPSGRYSEVDVHKPAINSASESGTKNIPSLSGVKGWLLFFCVSLTIISPLAMIVNVWMPINTIPKTMFVDFPYLSLALWTDAIISLIVSVIGVIVGSRLWQRKKAAVRWAKIFLLFYLSTVVAEPFYVTAIAQVSPDLWHALVNQGIKNIIGAALYTVVWYAYLARSKRVKFTFTEE